jgi:thioredoxin 1
MNIEEQQNGHAVLFKFWAEWCQPCMSLKPIVEEVISEFNQIQLINVNVDDNSDVAVQYNVRSLPTLLIVKDGVVAGRMTGSKSAEQVRQFISNHI